MPKVGLSICFNHVVGGGGGGDVLHDPISPHPSTPLRKQANLSAQQWRKRNALSTHLTSVDMQVHLILLWGVNFFDFLTCHSFIVCVCVFLLSFDLLCDVAQSGDHRP